MGGKRSRTSTPILAFPHHKGEGDEIRTMLIHKGIVERHRDMKGDVFFRSIGVLSCASLLVQFIAYCHIGIDSQSMRSNKGDGSIYLDSFAILQA